MRPPARGTEELVWDKDGCGSSGKPLDRPKLGLTGDPVRSIMDMWI